jgi:glycine C-acetyltransferase
MYGNVKETLNAELEAIREAGLYKNERVIVSDQAANITVDTGAEVLNFCANNYLGLSNNSDLIDAAKSAMDQYGFGLSSVRFICGTQDQHKGLEAAVSAFLETEDTILYTSCFDANAGLFETILGPDDAIISDALNHASIIDGVRLCKAKRFRFLHMDMVDLESKLQEAQSAGCPKVMIATDGVFRWMETSLRWKRFAIWPIDTVPWSWWMTPTRLDSPVRPEEEALSIAASWAGWM